MNIWSNVHACFFMPFQATAGLFRYCLNVSLRARTCNPTHSLNKHCWQCAVPLSEKIGHVLSKGTALNPLFFSLPLPLFLFMIPHGPSATAGQLRHSTLWSTVRREGVGDTVSTCQRCVRSGLGEVKKKTEREGGLE